MAITNSYKNLTVRMDENIKRQFDETLDNIGLNASVAVNMFARLVIRERGIPFAVTGKNANHSEEILPAKEFELS